MAQTVSIDFSEPVSIIPLPGVGLLPHTAMPLHVIEPSCLQLITDALEDRDEERWRPVALATICADARQADPNPPVRDVVCVAHIVQHREHPDGGIVVVLQGLCRAAITKINEPKGNRTYRTAQLRVIEDPNAPVPGLGKARRQLRDLMSGLRLQRMHSARAWLNWIDQHKLTDSGAIELAAFAMIKNEELRYRILCEADPYERAKMIWCEIDRTDRLIAKAQSQTEIDLPRGVHWN